jgi:hypothetical protein
VCVYIYTHTQIAMYMCTYYICILYIWIYIYNIIYTQTDLSVCVYIIYICVCACHGQNIAYSLMTRDGHPPISKFISQGFPRWNGYPIYHVLTMARMYLVVMGQES